MTSPPRLRVGIGYDSHRFAAGRPLILAGQTIPAPEGLHGHSDADAVAHALTDALLGATALGDIGQHFPDDDPAWKGTDSLGLLRRVLDMIREAGWAPVQADLTVIAERPRLTDHVPAMRRALAAVLGVDQERVSVKAKTNEGMGWIGRGEGIAVLAVATVEAR